MDDIRVQLLIIGDQEVGKTAILHRYANNEFSSFYLATVGVDYYTKEDVIDGQKVKVKIWDTAGQERYKSLTANFFRNAQGIILAYDLTNPESFENLKYWIQSLNSNLGENTPIKKVIFGNKADLKREVEQSAAETFANETKISYFEGSAKENFGLKECITDLIKRIIKDMPKKAIDDSVTIKKKKDDEKNDKKCC